jgi:hypothetical protein
MSEELYVHPDGMEQAGRSSYRTADSAEQVRRNVGRVHASAGSYGGATGFVSALNNAADGHTRGAGRAAEERDTMGDGDHGAAGFSRDLDAEAGRLIRGTAGPPPPDLDIARGI